MEERLARIQILALCCGIRVHGSLGEGFELKTLGGGHLFNAPDLTAVEALVIEKATDRIRQLHKAARDKRYV